MLKLKYFFEKNRMIIMISLVILICSIAIAFGVYAQITNLTKIEADKKKVQDNYEQLKDNFREIFTNTINKEATANLNRDYENMLICKYNKKEEIKGKYNINVKIPELQGDTQVINKINKEINDKFTKEVVKIVKQERINVSYDLNYVAYVNGDVISIVIMCKYKLAENPQRTIIKTYNYNVKEDRLLTIQDMLEYKKLDKEIVQEKIKQEIAEENKQMQAIAEQGYNVYVRDEQSDMYKVKNTPNYFLGKNNYLYLVYSYGNDEETYTSEIDLVIF